MTPAILLQRGVAVLIIGIAAFVLWRDRKPKNAPPAQVADGGRRQSSTPPAGGPKADDPDPERTGAKA
jgi:hypothetical protein